MSINSLMISRILPQYTAEYITNVFWYQNIAKVSSITLLPYLQGSDVFQTAYVTIATWSDSEVAYNLIQRLKDNVKKTRIVHHDDLWWPVTINTHIAGYYYLDPYTTTFSETYFQKPEEPEEPETPLIKLTDRVITEYKGSRKYTAAEALRRYGELCEAIMESNSQEQPSSLAPMYLVEYWQELGYLEDQLRDYRSKLDEDYENDVTKSLTKYFGIRDSGKVNPDYINERLSFLRTIMSRYSFQDPKALLTMMNINSEIEFLKDRLVSFTMQNSENITFHHHKQSFVV